jgi:hypothetical protein
LTLNNKHSRAHFSSNFQSQIYTSLRHRLITGVVTRLTRQAPLVEKELLIFPEHLSSPRFLVGFVSVTRSLFSWVCFVDRCLSFCPFPFGHCVVCPSSIYGFWLPLWYLQGFIYSGISYYINPWYLQTLFMYTFKNYTDCKCNVRHDINSHDWSWATPSIDWLILSITISWRACAINW